MPTNNSIGEVYYVNYPQYNILDGYSSVPAAVGHAGVLAKGKDGKFKYYEYGTYNDQNVYGVKKQDNTHGN